MKACFLTACNFQTFGSSSFAGFIDEISSHFVQTFFSTHLGQKVYFQISQPFTNVIITFPSLQFKQVSLVQISSMQPGSHSECETRCDMSGCKCITEHNMKDIDHLLITSTSGDHLSCFCGKFKVRGFVLSHTLQIIIVINLFRVSH